MGDHGGVANSRGSQTVRDMILSMAVLGVVVGGIWWLFIPHDAGADPVRPVSYQVELGQARRDAPFAVAVPEGLGKGWRATSVTYDGARSKAVTWHLGLVDPKDEYAAVEQSNASGDAFVRRVSQDAEPDGGATVTVGGVAWERWEGSRYDALVHRGDGVTTVVTGTAPQARLAELAAALRYQRSAG
jgi:hypothetical protein